MSPQELTYSIESMNSDELLGELILYIAEKCSNDPTFGATKLNKILYFADTNSYLHYGKPITGAEYMRLGRGPVPKRLVLIREKLIEKKELVIAPQSYYGYPQLRPIALRSSKLDKFTSKDISIVDIVIDELWGKSADEVSRLSHGIAWQIVNDRESIPYQAAFLTKRSISEDEINDIQELITEYGWDV